MAIEPEQPEVNGHNAHADNITRRAVHEDNTASNRVNPDGCEESQPDMATSVPIAVVGMSCRFSGDATNPHKLWEMCAEAKEGWSTIPAGRFDASSLYNQNKERIGSSHVVGGYFMQEDISLFDAAFFNFSSEVASAMDPQVRLLLELVYESTEDAGIPIHSLSSSNTSMFSGTYGKDYHDLTVKDPEIIPASFITGNGSAMLSNRISHFYDLRGASATIDTGCSSGLVALHQACRSIQAGESDLSIVGASSMLINPDLFIAMSSQGVLGADGRCYAWDSRAHGYGRGEGVAALVLKPLTAALRDSDRIHAVIRQTALNQDGKTTTISSPSLEAQEALIKDCYRRAGLNMADTGYVEAHMTGTPTGDLIEAQALARTFGESRSSGDPILVGSVKTNLGHTEPVSGLAAVIKTAYALKHGLIPPNLNYKSGNPSIKLREWKLDVPKALTTWPAGKALRASVNNFGYGGTNAHIIMESAPARAAARADSPHPSIEADGQLAAGPEQRVFVISGKDSFSSEKMTQNLAAHLRQKIADGGEPSLDDLAYTLAERRSRFPWLVTARASSITELAERLEKPGLKASQASSKAPRLGFVFNGQGAQWHAMGRELLSAYPVFASSVQAGDRILRNYGAKWSLQEELMREKDDTRVHDTNLSQPISVALQLSLVDLLRTWGLQPSAVVSHSSGEIAAAYAVGALSFEQALGVVYHRGELALKHQKLASLKGGMLAAGMSAERAETYLEKDGGVVVACINSPESVTLSGDLADLDIVAARLQEDGVFARRLQVPLAYHSHHMVHMAQEYTDALKPILSHIGDWTGAKFASPTTGELLSSPQELVAEHWVRNLTSPVLFSKAFEAMCFGTADPQGDSGDSATTTSRRSPEVDFLLEIGAHSTLSGPIRQILKDQKIPYGSCLKRSVDAVETMQEVACDLLSKGYPVALNAVNFPRDGPAVVSRRFVDDLPTYAWNHSTKYWSEPRVHREHRFRRYPRHELLGIPMPGSNATTPTWKNFLRLIDVPWLLDHQIDSKIVVPGAAYVAMAVEAVRLVTGPSMEQKIRGYRLRDVDILNALAVPDGNTGVETQFTLRPASRKELDHDGWYDFELYSTTGSSWVQHCKGSVSVDTTSAGKSETTLSIPVPQRSQFLVGEGRNKPKAIDIESIFEGLREMSIFHGTAFQNLIDATVAGDRSLTNIRISATAGDAGEYVLHPTTLDSIIQATYSGLPEETRKNSMVIPRSIDDMYVPQSLNRSPGERIEVFSRLMKSAKSGASSTLTALNSEEGSKNEQAPSSVLRIGRLYCQAVPRDTELQSQEPGMCFKSRWELDVLHDMPSELKDSMRIRATQQELEFEKKLLRASYLAILDAVNQLHLRNSASWQWYHQRFHRWMESIVRLGESGKLAPGSDKWSKTSKGLRRMLLDDLRSQNSAGGLTVRVGERLTDIVKGDINPLELMMEDGLLHQYYQDIPRLKERTYKHVSKIVDLYARKQPGANVLEIGAGTGGATAVVLESFAAWERGQASNRGKTSGNLLGHYDFTDLSSGFFDAAREKFASWGDLIDYKRLDIESDPEDQAFETGTYDLIVASAVLHATKNLQKTMSNVRKLLKPGGKLLMIEATQDRLDTQLIFGTLAGWWLSEEPEREMSPNVPAAMWDDVLKKTGFTGIEFEIGDCEEPDVQSASVILTTAAGQAPSYPSRLSIIHANPAPSSQWLNDVLKAVQKETGSSIEIQSLDDAVVDDRVCIFVEDVAAPILQGLNASSFERLRYLATGSAGLLWVSRSGVMDSSKPLFSQTQGLLRTLKQEDTGKRYVHLDLDIQTEPWSVQDIPHIVHALKQGFDGNINTSDIEWELAVKDNRTYVPRVFPDEAQANAIREAPTDPEPEAEPFHQPGRALVWETDSSGLLSNLHFTEKLDIAQPVPEGMVEIEPKAFGLNFRDVMTALGQLDETLIGSECSGIITRLGPGTESSGLSVGDKVCGMFKGRFASTVRAWSTGVAKIPDGMSWAEAASIPIIYITAYHCLFDLARLRKGEKVLIHAATGGVGQAALMLAQWAGAEVFVTCSTAAKRDFLINRYHVDPEQIFSSRDDYFAAQVMDRTDGAGVDVVINSLAGPLLKATWDCMARFGRFLEIGKVDMEAARNLDMTPFTRGATIAGVDVLQLNDYKGTVLQNALVSVLRLCQEGAISPVFPITEYSISDMEQAMRHMQGGTHLGKLVLTPRPGDKVQVISRPRPVDLNNPDATYLIAGGLGGIGRALAIWMIEKGAKHILLVSRNAESHPEASKLTDEARSQGCNLLIRNCDISDEHNLIALLADCAGQIPPVRGVITAAMLLNDSVMERMTFDQWNAGVRPKVAGTLNLHNNLHDLDFFIMLSSLTGVVGHASQANYGAGNTFQDALARHRTSLGLPAVSLDLGAIMSVGFVAESGDSGVRERVEKKLGSVVMELSTLLRLVESAVRDGMRQTPDDSQVITCIPPYELIKEDAGIKRDRRFSTLWLGRSSAGTSSSAAAGAGSASATGMLTQSLSKGFPALSDAVLAITEALMTKLADMFNILASDIDTSLPMSQYGVDSLVAVELRNWLGSAAKAKVSIFDIVQSPSLTDFGSLVAGKSEFLKSLHTAEVEA